MSYEKLNERILELKDEMFQTIKESVAIDSVKSAPEENAPYGQGNKMALDHLLAVGKKMGFKTGNCDNRVGWIEYGEGDEMVGILGHLDVVPLGDGWIHPPLACEVHDGKMYGRGVQDDKGPTIGGVYALKAIKDLGLPLDRRIRILFGCDEEEGSSCVAHYIESGEELPTIGFTPDAQFPAIFCEKGQAFFFMTKELNAPSDIKVLSLEGGVAKNIVPSDCKMILEGEHDLTGTEFVTVIKENGNTLISAVGTSAHGSTPEQGVNAITRLLQVVKKLKFGGDFQKVIDFLTTCIGTEFDGASLGIARHDEETGDTTVNLGVIKCNENEAYFTLDIRYPKNACSSEIVPPVKEKLAAYDLPANAEEHPLLYVPKDSELVQKLMSVYAAQTGDTQTESIAIGGATYAKSFKNMVAYGPVFPGETEVIHQPNEYAIVENLVKAVQVMGAAMYELAQK